MTSVGDGTCLAALRTTFSSVDDHFPLETGKRSEATIEIARLFGGTSSWAHFQCHVSYANGRKEICLTRKYMVGPDRFRTGGRHLAAIFLNYCRATTLLSGDIQSDGLRSSWGEDFLAEAYVPVVIGPMCALTDARTMPFSQTFYAELAKSHDIFDAFVEARRIQLEAGDPAALIYRYLGQATGATLPEGCRGPDPSLPAAA